MCVVARRAFPVLETDSEQDSGYINGVMGMRYFVRMHTGIPYPDPSNYDSQEAYDDASAAYQIPADDKSLITSILSAGTFFGAIIA